MNVDDDKAKELIKEGIGPVCGTKLKHVEGCRECIMCGWSICGEA
ncbi:MAG: hypothetical protein V1827_00780 [Candidatus Micrarchaeota archaeon]